MTNETNDTRAVADASNREGAAEGGIASPYQHLPLEEQVAFLEKELEVARGEVAQNLDLAQRTQAEFANYRRRSDDERASSQKYANGRLIVKLLPVVDELEMAITQAGEHTTNAPWLEGVRLIQRKLASLLNAEGVTTIDATGAIFNPVEHEAVDSQETTIHPPGYVTKVLRCGYRLHDRVIQAAQVVVAREPQKFTETNNFPQVKETEYD